MTIIKGNRGGGELVAVDSGDDGYSEYSDFPIIDIPNPPKLARSLADVSGIDEDFRWFYLEGEKRIVVAVSNVIEDINHLDLVGKFRFVTETAEPRESWILGHGGASHAGQQHIVLSLLDRVPMDAEADVAWDDFFKSALDRTGSTDKLDWTMLGSSVGKFEIFLPSWAGCELAQMVSEGKAIPFGLQQAVWPWIEMQLRGFDRM